METSSGQGRPLDSFRGSISPNAAERLSLKLRANRDESVVQIRLKFTHFRTDKDHQVQYGFWQTKKGTRDDPQVQGSKAFRTNGANHVQIEFGNAASTPCLGQQRRGITVAGPGRESSLCRTSARFRGPPEKVTRLHRKSRRGWFQRSDEQVAGAVVSQLLGITRTCNCCGFARQSAEITFARIETIANPDQAWTSNKLRRIETAHKMRRNAAKCSSKRVPLRCEFASQRLTWCRGRFGLAD